MKKFVLTITVLSLGACASAPELATPPLDPRDGTTASVLAMPAASLNTSKPLTRISFGSCLSEKEDQSIWTKIKAENADLFVFMGDNVYGDAAKDDPAFSDPAMPKMRASYAQLAKSAPFADFRKTTPMMVAWDDHDYGVNDGGVDYAFKARAKDLFLDAWAIPADDPRQTRDGTYTAQTIGPEGQRVQIILLDTRSFRTGLTPTDENGAPGKERYLPSTDKTGTMLGDAQWGWLEQQLNQPVNLRIIVSSIQVIADGHGWEAWATMPHERERLYQLLAAKTSGNTILLSGDRHIGAFYSQNKAVPFYLLEVTSSSLNRPASKWRAENGETSTEAGPYRISPIQYEVNYGLMDINWTQKSVTLQIVSPGNETMTKNIDF